MGSYLRAAFGGIFRGFVLLLFLCCSPFLLLIGGTINGYRRAREKFRKKEKEEADLNRIPENEPYIYEERDGRIIQRSPTPSERIDNLMEAFSDAGNFEPIIPWKRGDEQKTDRDWETI